MITQAEFYVELAKYRQEYPQLRKGQATFNLLHSHMPQIANEHVGTDTDPFYHDERSDEFVRLCFKKYRESQESPQ